LESLEERTKRGVWGMYRGGKEGTWTKKINKSTYGQWSAMGKGKEKVKKQKKDDRRGGEKQRC